MTLVVVVAFGAAAHGLFVRQQDGAMRRLLEEDLVRVATLLDRPVVGASFVASSEPGFVVQVVAADEQIALAWGGDVPLPLVDPPAARVVAGRRTLVGSAPWREAGATIRVAHDLEDALATRAQLGRSLIVGGAVTFVVASLLAVVVARRALRPLERLAADARRVDPAAPGSIAYAGRGEEIRAITDALNETLAAIRDRIRREHDFLLEIAHELAGPLTLVHYHLSALRRERSDDPALRAAADAAQELLRTSQDLLVLARGETERPLETSVVALRDVLGRLALEYPGVALAATGRGDVVGDADRLVQVFRNLVRNGVQAAGRPEGVRVELVETDDVQVVQVSDDGPGLTPELRERIFERGFRRGAGTGVGLAIAKDLVERHGGTVRAVAGSAPGATLEVRLPALAARLDPTGPGAPR